MIGRTKRLDLERALEKAFDENLPQYVDEVKVQLYHGFDGNGERLRPYANDNYAAKKTSMNPLPGFGNPDLHLTGAWYNGIETQRSGQSLKTASSDEKNKMLIKKYGYAVLIPGGKFKASFVQENLRPDFIKEIKQILFK